LDPILILNDYLEGLIIGSNQIRVDKLHLFKHLNFIGLPDNKIDTVDLTIFVQLTTLACEYSQRLKGLDTCTNLKSLTLTKYKSQSKDLTTLPSLASLEFISFIQPVITSIKGIELNVNIHQLEIFSATQLVNISSLTHVNCLEVIVFEKCPKIRNISILGGLGSLKKIVLADSGSIDSLSFIKTLHNLEFISFWGTNILDGNLSYCEGIKYVSFDNKKHYTHKQEHFTTQTK
jgi:hypothetical protein